MDEQLKSIERILEALANDEGTGAKRANMSKEDLEGFRALLGLPIKEKYQGIKNIMAKYIVRPNSNAFGVEGFWMLLKLLEIKMAIDDEGVKDKFPKPPFSGDNPFQFN